MNDKVYLNYIGGEWCDAVSGEVFENRNPARPSEIVSRHAFGGPEDIRAAMAAARKAFDPWKDTPLPERARIFGRAVDLLKGRIDELAEGMTREEGKVFKEARGEILKGLNLMEFYVGEGWRLHGQTLPSEMYRTFTYTVRQPLGPVGIITPWNFPFAIPVWKLAPCLIAGNTAVFKPSEWSPLTATRLVEILEEAGLPKGVLNLVNGNGAGAGSALVAHEDLTAISFTGSTAVGRHINEAVAGRMIKVTCEMGGKNPVVVLDDADLDLAVLGIFQGAFGSTGQRCTATSRLILTPGIRDEVLSRLAKMMEGITCGDGMEPGVTMGPAVDARQKEKILAAIDRAEVQGATVYARTDVPEGLHEGHFVPSVLLTDVQRDMDCWRKEIFGPVLSVMEARSLEEAIELANDTEYGLSSSLYANDVRAIQRFIEASDVGMVHINSPTIGGEAQLPFGGVKNTGIGDREMGTWGIEFFTELKTVFVDWTGKARDTNIY